jgi:hypothetical protein
VPADARKTTISDEATAAAFSVIERENASLREKLLSFAGEFTPDLAANVSHQADGSAPVTDLINRVVGRGNLSAPVERSDLLQRCEALEAAVRQQASTIAVLQGEKERLRDYALRYEAELARISVPL